jgi:hypothetical protein
MNKKSSFVIIFIVSFLFSQEEIIHISKTHRDGTPKEVIIYEIVNDDLQSNNPFSIVEKIYYDSKGNYVKPKIKGAAKMANRGIVGEWKLDPNLTKQALKRDGLKGEELEMGLMFFSEISIIFEFKENGTFLMSMSGFGESESLTGVWELNGSTLKTRDTGQGEWEQFEIVLSREKLFMKKGKETLGFKRVK